MSTQANNKKISETLRKTLLKYNFIPKIKLGQHFMIDPATLDRIIQAGELSKNDLVIEIGTGTGILTEKIAEAAGQVISVEYDKILIEIARDLLKGYKNVELIREDFLKLDLKKITKKYPEFKSYKIVANLPYYITAPIVTKIIETKPGCSLAVLTVQAEVADRMIAKAGPKEYGSFSIYVQYHFDPHIVSFIPKSAFIPHPAVKSAIVMLRPRNAPPVKVKNERMFFDIVHAAFEHRRKTLRNAILISKKFKLSSEKLDLALEKAGIDGGRRGETLSLKEFSLIADSLN